MPDPSLQQVQSLQQVLSPQMRQSLKMLQAPTVELQALLSQALEQNPVLEMENRHESLDEIGAEAGDFDDEFTEAWEDDSRDLEIMERRGLGDPQDLQAKRDFFFESVVAPTSLGEHLRRQLMTCTDEPSLLEAGEVLISYLNSRGFLEHPLEEIAVETRSSLDDLQKAKALLEAMDPPGVGALDLRDCLLIQLRSLGEAGSPLYCLVNEYFDAVLERQFSRIAREMGLEVEEVEELVRRLAQMDSSPGSAFDATHNPHIQEDLVAERDASGEWVLRSNNEFLPTLKINDEYKQLLAGLSRDREARRYLRDQFREARSLIRSLEQRQQTLLMIGGEIVRRQQAVLTGGLAALKPMTMNDVAEELDLHATTVSRAVAGKYLRCPAGLLELRAFFTSGYERDDGSAVSNAGVKSRIKELVDGEDPRKPISDQAIVEMLKSEGMPIARRTVAKYREQLNIPPTHQRRVR